MANDLRSGGTVAASHTITLHDIVKHYGTKAAVDCPSLTVAGGEFLTLLGPSGSGKTTLLMMIAGFTVPTAGKIAIDGRDITRLPPEKRNFGMVFQGYALFPHMTVAENIAFPLQMRGVSKAEIARKVATSLDRVRLSGLAERLPKQLSGGQQQRVALARSLVFEPQVLLLDEPLSALDRSLREEMQVELKILHDMIGMTFLCVTHDQDEALSMSDRIAVMHDGRIAQIGAPRDLYERPASRFVAGFLGTSNFLSGKVIDRIPGRIRYEIDGVALEQAGPLDSATGDIITIALRPEAIRLGPPVEGSPNHLPGKVVTSSYFGNSVAVILDTPAGRITVHQPLGRDEALLRPDETVSLSWEPAASIPVTDRA